MSSFGQAFEEAQRPAMSFLVSEYGFRLSEIRIIEEEGTQFVLGTATYREVVPWYRWGATNRFVSLSVAPLRLELDLDIGRGKKRREHYDIYALHELEGTGPFPHRTHDLYKAMYDAGQLQAEFERLAHVLRSCGGRFFADDTSLWVDLRKQRDAAMQASQDSHVLNRADVAFKAKEWQKVVDLLEDLERRLDNVHQAKLKYARKHSKHE